MADKFVDLKLLKSKCSFCTACPLYKGRTKTVFGEGNVDSPVVFIGEAPGANEDKQGKPFVGAAGSIYNEALNSIGFNRGDVYTTNVCKCQPPGNRVPSTEEAEICKRHFLMKEIRLINPKVVVPMGNTACLHILGKTGITSFHGKVIEKNGITYLPTFHPAAVIYNRITIEYLVKDFRIVRNLSK